MLVRPIKTRIFREGENLFNFINQYIKKLPEKSVLVVTSKIVALSEKRTAIIKNEKERGALIRAESQMAVPTNTPHVWMTIKDGMIMASAGIDESNANGKLILLPKDSFKTATYLRGQLKKKFKIKNLGLLITDSRVVPLRAGVTGVTIGYAGFRGLKNYIGTPDLFGKKFVFSTTNIADCLATAGVLTMGEGREQQPLAIITNAPVEFCEKINHRELLIETSKDMYLPFFSKVSPKKYNR